MNEDGIELERRLVSEFDTIAQMPGGEPVRFRCREWTDLVSMRDSANGFVLERSLPRFEVGLVVTYVTQDSPAAKAGIQKNDVLVEFGGQSLVHPAQSRKLISSRKEGDIIKLGFYRAGQKLSPQSANSENAFSFYLLSVDPMSEVSNR